MGISNRYILYHVSTVLKLLPSFASEIQKPLPIVPPLCALICSIDYFFFCSIAALTWFFQGYLIVLFFSVFCLFLHMSPGFFIYSLHITYHSILDFQSLHPNYEPLLMVCNFLLLYNVLLSPLNTSETSCGRDYGTLGLNLLVYHQGLLHLCFLS